MGVSRHLSVMLELSYIRSSKVESGSALRKRENHNMVRMCQANLVLSSLLLALCSVATSAEQVATKEDVGDRGFVSLFDGTDLTAWTMGPDRSWIVRDGLITLRREMDGREHNADYLWTKETYRDFILELEFKIPERANSGVFLRTPDLADPVYTGIEVQVSNSYGKSTWGKGNCAGAIYDCLAPTANPVKEPGQWNQYKITCDDNKITVVLNGQQIVNMDLDRWAEPNRNPDGTKNKFPRAIKDFAREGHIGLQDHGREVSYRNIRVKRLD